MPRTFQPGRPTVGESLVEGDVLQPTMLLAPAVQQSLVHYVAGLVHQSVIGSIIINVVVVSPATAAAASSDVLQAHSGSGAGGGILTAGREHSLRGFKEEAQLPAVLSWLRLVPWRDPQLCFQQLLHVF